MIDIPLFFQALVNGLLIGCLYSLMAIGLNLILGVMKIINFAHGDVIMIAMYITYWLHVLFGINPYLAILPTMIIIAIFGLPIMKLLIEPILKAPALSQLLITIALGIFLQSFAQLAWKSDYRTLYTEVFSLDIGGILMSGHRVIAALIAFITTLVVYFFLMKTHTGIKIRGTAQDIEIATVMGIDIRKEYYLTFCLGFALTGLCGGLLMLIYSTYPTAGFVFGLMAWIIVVVGGLGSFIGAFLGGLIIGVIEVIAATFLNIELARAIAFLIFILIILKKPEGLFGSKARV